MSAKATGDYIAAYQRWCYLYEVGGQDPFYADGTNLYLTRNHMVHAIRDGAIVPDDMPLPEPVSMDYMADVEGIVSRASELLSKVLADADTQRLLELDTTLMSDELKAEAEHSIRYVRLLQRAVNQNDYLSMRRITRNLDLDRPKKFFELLSEYESKDEQISLFDVIQEGTT